MGGGLSLNPKPAPDDGYNVSVDEHALPWTFQGETDADTVIMSRRVGSMGLSGDKKGPSRRGVGGTKWNKAKHQSKARMRSGRREALSRRVEPRPVLMARMAGSPLTVSLDHGRIEALKSSNSCALLAAA